MNLKKIITIVILFFIYTNVFAIDACTTTEMTRLKELANNVEVKTNHNFDIVNQGSKTVYVLYDIEILNLDEDLKISYKDMKDSEGETISLKPNENKIEGIAEGKTINIYIYSYTINMCTDRLLRTITINLPYYSDFYYLNKDRCIENQDFEYCKEFVKDSSKIYEVVEGEFEDFLKAKEAKEEPKNNNINDIYIYIAIGAIGLITIIVIVLIIIRRKIKKKEDL